MQTGIINEIKNATKSSNESSLSLNVMETTSNAHSEESTLLSLTELVMLKSKTPIEIPNPKEVSHMGVSSVLVNKSEIENWKGEMDVDQYQLNEDSNPEFVFKKSNKKVEYIQELAVKYLKPTTPDPPGDIIINIKASKAYRPPPPLILRHQPPRPNTPLPLVIRELPPTTPKIIKQKIITIQGKRQPPPPRRVIIERLAELPAKPPSVIIERWLPYKEMNRKVTVNRSFQKNEFLKESTIKNLIIQWKAPDIKIERYFSDLGTIRANPYDYIQTYGR